MPDITRYARHPRHTVYIQALAIPFVIILTGHSWQLVYPPAVVTLWDKRSAKLFAGLRFAFANIGANVTDNSVP